MCCNCKDISATNLDFFHCLGVLEVLDNESNRKTQIIQKMEIRNRKIEFLDVI